ncbi:MAG: tetratricopeptide repeat protein [Myxococcales bacterium]|nr:tetratricopeptide repeat protein [Myxococcales bacterium]MCB9534385.1 tetratricopeptide repeat protein [Myxococcales bacterium]
MHSVPQLRRARLAAGLALLLALGVAACGGSQKRADEAHEQADFHYQLSIGHWRAHEVPNAIRELNTALELDPNHQEALYLLGFIYQGRYNFAETERLYRRALEVRPDWYEVMNNLGTVYLMQERWPEAEELFRDLVAAPTYSTPGHAYNNLGWSVYKQGRVSEALEYFMLATRFQPELCLAYNNQGIANAELGNPRGAVEAYGEAISRCADYQEPRYRLALLLYDLGRDADRASALLEECVALGDTTPIGRRCDEYLHPSDW